MADICEHQARDSTREAFLAPLKTVNCGQKPKRRQRIIRQLLAGAAQEFDELVDIAAHCDRN